MRIVEAPAPRLLHVHGATLDIGRLKDAALVAMGEVGGEIADRGVARLQLAHQLIDRRRPGRLLRGDTRRKQQQAGGGDAGQGARQPFRAPALGGFCFGASLLSVGSLAASHSTMPPSSTLALHPSRISAAATRAPTTSSGSES